MISKQRISALSQLTTEDNWSSNKGSTPIEIPIKSIAYAEWQPSRTERILEAISEGNVIDPIKVIYYRINGSELVYDPSDGNHRCKAQEVRQETEVVAYVDGGYTIDTDDYIVYQKMVWLKTNTNEIECISIDILDDWLIEELKVIGVQVFEEK